MGRILSTVFLLSSIMAVSLGQTFQYSRGWTNGKRAENPGLGGFPAEYKSANLVGRFSGSQMAHLPTPCQVQKLKMLLQGNGNEQLYLLPCEFLISSGTSLSEFPAVGRFGHAPVQNDNNNY